MPNALRKITDAKSELVLIFVENNILKKGFLRTGIFLLWISRTCINKHSWSKDFVTFSRKCSNFPRKHAKRVYTFRI